MKVLVDTNVFIRWVADQPVPRAVEKLLLNRSVEKFVSLVSAWEIAMKPALRLSATDTERGIAAMGAVPLPLRFRHFDALRELPMYAEHRDPFDRLLIAQATAEGLAVTTSDERFERYGVTVVWE